MALNPRQFGNIAVGPIMVLMGYKTPDSIHEVVAPGYFDRARSTMRVNDVILVMCAEGMFMTTITAVPKDRQHPVITAMVQTELPPNPNDDSLGLGAEDEAVPVKTTRRRAA
jgi:hypothetical protein